jgi:hypothetical protein
VYFKILAERFPAEASDSGWGKAEYAIGQPGIRQILLCGHSHCHFSPTMRVIGQIDEPRARNGDVPDSAARLTEGRTTLRSQLWLNEQRKRLSSFLDRRAHRTNINTYALWFYDDRGTLFTWSPDAESFALADCTEIRRLFGLIGLSSKKTQRLLSELEDFCRIP